MKRFFTILTATLLLLPACTDNDSIRTENLSLNDETPFSEGSQFSLNLDFNVDFPVSGFEKEALAQVRKTIRKACFGDAYADFTAPVKDLAQAVRDEYAADYVSSNESFLRDMEITEAEANNLNWGFDIKGSFGETYGDYINYIVERYEYMGGAHGMYSLFPIVFDRKTGQTVTAEVFTNGVSRERLTELIDQHKFDELEDMIDDDINREDIFYVEVIEPSDYFSVGEKGLTYYYQPYDVAPYVIGLITITIPWEEMR